MKKGLKKPICGFYQIISWTKVEKMTELYFLVSIIALFSIVQSMFGVGLLLFGTPTLLLLEYSYSETLWLLLPCSLTISLIQVVGDYKFIEAKKRAVYFVIPTFVNHTYRGKIYDNIWFNLFN